MRLIVGISGASGAIMGYELLKVLRELPEVETHLVLTKGAEETFALETEHSISDVRALADISYDIHDMAAPISSGSYRTEGMIVLPCSMKTVAGIASGFSSNLLLRAADVCLKEGRTLVLSPREMPLSRIHLRNLKEAAEAGCTIIPPMLTFYNQANTIELQIRHIIGKILHPFGIEYRNFRPWNPSRESGLRRD